MLAEVIRTNCQEEKNSKAYATNIIQETFKDFQKLVQSETRLEQHQLVTIYFGFGISRNTSNKISKQKEIVALIIS